MAEYAILTARTMVQSVGTWSRQVETGEIVGAAAIAILLWMLWRTFGPR